ncbi:MAG: hypothetical protein ABIV06_12590 [Thermoanaerobaculia bacterium]
MLRTALAAVSTRLTGGSASGDLDRQRFAWLVAGLFALVTVPRLLTHELWRDEAWLWLVATESRTLADLASSLARSGQGSLFPLLCYFASGFSVAPRVLQGLHLVLAVAGVFAFVRWAPLRRAHRVLFVLGYLPFYEYAVISRHYAAGALLLWLACAAMGRRRPAIALGAALGLLCQTTVYGFILAVAVGAGWLVDRRIRRQAPADPAPPPSASSAAPIPLRTAAVGLALAAAGGIAGILQLVPDAGTSFAQGWRFGWHPMVAARVLQAPWRAFVPLPLPGLHFWNSNLFDGWPNFQTIAGLLALAGAIAFVWPRKAALVTFLIGAAGFSAFGYVKFIGSIRHDGHWWLLFLAAIWMGGGLTASATQNGRAALRRSWRSPLLLVLLILHCASGAYASWIDLRQPFSNAARTALAVRGLGLDRLPLLGYREPPAAPVALALGQALFSPSRGRFVTHPDWGPEQHDLTLPVLRCAARALAAAEGRDIGLVVNRELPQWEEIEAQDAVLGAIEASEDYHLYRLYLDRLTRSALAAGCPAD